MCQDCCSSNERPGLHYMSLIVWGVKHYRSYFGKLSMQPRQWSVTPRSPHREVSENQNDFHPTSKTYTCIHTHRAVCHDSSAFFLCPSSFMSMRARAGWLTPLIPLITLQQSTNPHTQTARWTDGLRHTCTQCLTLISGLSTMPSPVLTGLYRCPEVTGVTVCTASQTVCSSRVQPQTKTHTGL